MLIARVARTLTQHPIGLKALMAVSGVFLMGWITLHALGNLLVFLGPETINTYGGALQGSALLVAIRLGLVAALVTHIASAITVIRRARASRRRGYHRPLEAQASTHASRSMRTGGLALGLYTAYHLLHIYGPLHADYLSGDVHHNLVVGLSDPLSAGLYAGAAVVLGLHLHHGAWSTFRTLGYDGPFGGSLRRGTQTFAAGLTLAFLAPCGAALAGWL